MKVKELLEFLTNEKIQDYNVNFGVSSKVPGDDKILRLDIPLDYGFVDEGEEEVILSYSGDLAEVGSLIEEAKKEILSSGKIAGHC